MKPKPRRLKPVASLRKRRVNIAITDAEFNRLLANAAKAQLTVTDWIVAAAAK